MKTFFTLLCFLKFVSMKIAGNSEQVASAVSQIVEDYYANRSENFDIVVFGNETENLKFIVEKVIKTTKTPRLVMKIEQTALKIELKQSAILFFRTVSSFMDFENRTTLINEYPRPLNFVVCFESSTDIILLFRHDIINYSRFKSLSRLLMRSSFILQSPQGSIELMTFYLFQPTLCHQPSLRSINSFDGNKRKWKLNDFFPDKFSNFNGCEILFGISLAQKSIFKYENHVESGYGTTMINAMAKALNFEVKYHTVAKNMKVGTGQHSRSWDTFIFPNSWRKVKTSKDFGKLASILGISSLGFATHSFATVDYIILIPLRSPYTQYEKLFLPFEVEVWLGVVFVVSVGLTVILVLKFCPQFMQRFVFGLRVKTPVLNLM
jgi:hypothetical protein